MDAEKAKKAAELAEKELEKEEEGKQIQSIKKAIKQTLEAIEEKEKARTKLNKEIKTLKQDIDNIRAGRLDLIAERQEEDEEAKRTSIIEVTKGIHHHHYRDRWCEPYKITWKWDYNPYIDPLGCVTYGESNCVTLANNSIAKEAYVGTYLLDSGDRSNVNLKNMSCLYFRKEN